MVLLQDDLIIYGILLLESWGTWPTHFPTIIEDSRKLILAFPSKILKESYSPCSVAQRWRGQL